MLLWFAWFICGAIMSRLDLAVVFLRILICFLNSGGLAKNPFYFQFFMMFELVSAYGNVGLSMGSTVVPNASFAGSVPDGVKIVLMIVEMFGKTRMLPNTVAVGLARAQFV